MTLVAPRIVNDVSYVMRINHEIHFAWQAQYLVKLEEDSCCPRLFVSLAVRAPLWAAHCRDCSPCTETFVALQCARCCGLRVVFVASDRPTFCFLCGAHAAVGCSLSSSHPTTQAFRLHCRVASDCPRPSLPCNACFFFYRLTCFL